MHSISNYLECMPWPVLMDKQVVIHKQGRNLPGNIRLISGDTLQMFYISYLEHILRLMKLLVSQPLRILLVSFHITTCNRIVIPDFRSSNIQLFLVAATAYTPSLCSLGDFMNVNFICYDLFSCPLSPRFIPSLL